MNILLYMSAAFGYVVVGLAWGFLRWKVYVDAEIDFYESERQRFLRFHRIRGLSDKIPEFLVYEWRNYVKSNERLKAVPPKPVDFRGEISFDVLFWPLAMFVLAIQTGYKTLMKRVLSEYNKVTNKKIEKIQRDLKGINS